MIDPSSVDWQAIGNGAVELFRHHLPWLEDKTGGALMAIPVREAWEWTKKRLTSAGGREAVEKVEADPGDALSWDLLRPQLLMAVKNDAELREALAKLVEGAGNSATQTIVGDNNKASLITGSPGAKVSIS